MLHILFNSSFIFSSPGTLASVLPVNLPQTAGHVWLLLAEHGFASKCLSSSCFSSKAVCLLLSFSWTCGSLILVTFLFPACSLSLLDYAESRETQSSTCHLHECTYRTLNSVAWCNLHEDFVQLFSALATWTVWASRMVSWPVSERTSLPLSLSRAALQAKQVFILQGHPWPRPHCQLLSKCGMCIQTLTLETLYLLKSLSYPTVDRTLSSAGHDTPQTCEGHFCSINC